MNRFMLASLCATLLALPALATDAQAHGGKKKPQVQAPGPGQPQTPGHMQGRPQGQVQGARAAMPASPEVQETWKDIETTLGSVPTWLKEFPQAALPGFWQSQKGLLMNNNTALQGKHKELIGLAVSAQVPCKFCTFYHTEAARAAGATDGEIKEAVAIAGLVRHWSTFINGQALEMDTFKAETDRIVRHLRKGMAAGGPAESATPQAGKAALPADKPVTDHASALADIEKTLGMVPTFVKNYPPEALAGAWNGMKALMSPNTELPGKVKDLICLGVSAQIPCDYCVYWDTQLATKVDNASNREVREALAIAALIRQGSTIINGMQTDEATFQREMRAVFTHVGKSQPAGPGMTPAPQRGRIPDQPKADQPKTGY